MNLAMIIFLFVFLHMKLLIIDDNAGVRTTLKFLLAKEFNEIAAVGDPTLIPALLRGGDVDAVLLDMNFDTDNLDGSEGLFWLRRIKETPDAPCVVLITAFGDIQLAVEGMKQGAEDFITKPWDNDELIDKLHRAIKKNRQARSLRKSMENAIKIEAKNREQEGMTLDEIKIHHIKSVIDKCGGNLTAAADKLGINRQTLYNLLKKSEKH